MNRFIKYAISMAVAAFVTEKVMEILDGSKSNKKR